MKTVVSINWRIRDLIREKLSFEKWHLDVFDSPAPKKVLNKIKAKAKELAEMKQAVLLAAKDEACKGRSLRLRVPHNCPRRGFLSFFPSAGAFIILL